MNGNNKAPIWFISIFIIVGCVMLFFGIKGVYKTYKLSKFYLPTEGKLISYDKHVSDDSTSYYLIYSYEVNNLIYTIRTDYSTESIPDIGTLKTIKYNPDNPQEAYITGFNISWLLLIFGSMFTIAPFIMLLSNLVPKSEIGSKIVGKIMSTLIGLLFTGIGIGLFSVMGSNWSILEAFKINFFLTLISLLFAGLGIYILLSPFLLRRAKPLKLIVEKIDEIDNIYKILFSDINIAEGSFKSFTYKYFILETNDTNLKEGYIYEVNIYKYGTILNLVNIDDRIQARQIKGFNNSDFKYVDYKQKNKLDEHSKDATIQNKDKIQLIDKIIENKDVIGNVAKKVYGIQYIITGVIFIISILFLMLFSDWVIKIILIPFLICGIGVLLTGITGLSGKAFKLGKIIYETGFLTFWFGFLIVYDYIAIKNNLWPMLLFSLIFWIVGIFILVKLIKGE